MEKVGWTLRWAQGPGRQSGMWLLSAAAIATLPFLQNVAPSCGGDAACQKGWDLVFFLPDLLFIPAAMMLAALGGSWIAQRLHARFDKRFFLTLETDETPEIPPGHLRPVELETDVTRRTLRWGAVGLTGAAALFVYFAMTPVGRRACDPWQFRQPTGLDVCQNAAEWSDTLIAYQVWVFIVLSALWALILANRSRRFTTLRRRRLLASRKAEAAHP